MIRFTKGVLHEFDAATSREWLETNGIGGFAASTVIGLNTRRYHGLLTAAMRPPAGRVVLLSKFEETLVIDDRRYDLSANQYIGAVHPRGYVHLEEFRLDPFPTFRFEVEVFANHLAEAGLGHVSEIFDGDAPHGARGCFAQAWSVAEVLRAVVENGLAREAAKPKVAAGRA